MNKQESVVLFQNLQKLANLKGVKFAYAVSRNSALLKEEIEALEKAISPSKEFMEADEKRASLAKECAKKDEKGEPMTITENGVSKYVMEDEKAFEEKFKVLKEENKELWEARENQIKEYNELLKTESTVKLHKITLSDVPTDITVGQMAGIQELIEEAVPSPYPAK